MAEFIVNIADPDRETTLVDYAISLAGKCNAWLTGLCVVPVDMAVLALPDPLAVLAWEEQEALNQGEGWRNRCAAAGVTGEWEVLRGPYRKLMSERASLASLVLDRLPAWPAHFRDTSRRVAETLVRGACPVILVPDHPVLATPANHVVLAWNGSAPASRAARAALSVMKLAGRVTVLDGTRAGRRTLPLRDWLRRQGVEAEWLPLKNQRQPGPAIHQAVERLGADLLVHGTWGRRRTSERVFGGVTRHSLRHSTVPLMLAP